MRAMGVWTAIAEEELTILEDNYGAGHEIRKCQIFHPQRIPCFNPASHGIHCSGGITETKRKGGIIAIQSVYIDCITIVQPFLLVSIVSMSQKSCFNVPIYVQYLFGRLFGPLWTYTKCN